MSSTNQIGGRGETAAIRCFARPISGHYGFEVSFLGEKAQLLDLRVALLDKHGKVFGPHFYAQVKTHKKKAGRRFSTKFTSSETASAKAGLVPVYLIGVELDGDIKEDVWICAIEAQISLPSIPKTHDLSQTKTLLQVYDEVLGHFNSLKYTFTSKLK